MSLKIKNTFLILCTICIFSTNITYASALSDFLNSFFNYTPSPRAIQSGFQRTEAENSDSTFLSEQSETIPTIAKYYPQINEAFDTPKSYFSNTPSLTTNIPKSETIKATTPLAKILSSVLKKDSNVQSIRNVFGTSQPTREEVQKFQKDNKLSADGTIGPNTIKKIQKQAIENSEISNEPQNGFSKKDFATGKTELKPESATFQALLDKVQRESEKIKVADSEIPVQKEGGEEAEKGTLGGKILDTGFATNYGHNLDKSDDLDDNGITACGKNTRYNKPNYYKGKKYKADPNNCNYASLPKSTLIEMFGSAQCSAFQGKKIKVCLQKYPDNCYTYEIQEIGPGESYKKRGRIIDLTGCGVDKLNIKGKGIDGDLIPVNIYQEN